MLSRKKRSLSSETPIAKAFQNTTSSVVILEFHIIKGACNFVLNLGIVLDGFHAVVIPGAGESSRRCRLRARHRVPAKLMVPAQNHN